MLANQVANIAANQPNKAKQSQIKFRIARAVSCSTGSTRATASSLLSCPMGMDTSVVTGTTDVYLILGDPVDGGAKCQKRAQNFR